MKIVDIHKENCLGIMKRLSKYDPALNEHLSKLRDAQEKGISMQTDHLSNDIVNEFINIILWQTGKRKLCKKLSILKALENEWLQNSVLCPDCNVV